MLLAQLLDGTTVVGAILTLAIVAALGLAIGAVQVRGVGLGIAGVLFAGLGFGYAGVRLDERIAEFTRELGLVLFVYSIGIQVGPGFLASLRRHGLRLNLLAAAVVVAGIGVALLLGRVAGIEPAALVGILSGATTNTPSLAAAQQALKGLAAGDPAAIAQAASVPGIGYAVSYPFGVLGVIGSMLLLKALLRIDPVAEREALEKAGGGRPSPLARANLEVANPNLEGMSLDQVPVLKGSGIVVSRLFQDGELRVPRPDTRIRQGDVLLAVGSQRQLHDLRVVVGRESEVDLTTLASQITTKRIIVTRTAAAGRRLGELDFAGRYGVRVTRVGRAEVEIGAAASLELQYGDTLLAVGAPEDIRKVAAEVGDSPRDLNYPHLVPMFVGIALGVVLGSWPIALPGAPLPVRLGLAGGPLLVAIALARIGKLGPLVWYMPLSANIMLREIGIVLFLGAVGLKAGAPFIETLARGPGMWWMACGAAITVVPLLLVAAFARLFLKLNFFTLCGVLAGSTTDPPALAFAGAMAGSETPSLAYATVYPLTMILRVISAQLLVLFLAG